MNYVGGLQCNRCHNANMVVDCQRAVETCQPGQACYRDSTQTTYETSDRKSVTVWMYKMGCTFTPICRDGISYGPGPYGYSRIIRFCCCTDRCNAPDGTGIGVYTNCSSAVVNGTISDATSLLYSRHSVYCPICVVTFLSVLISLVFKSIVNL